MGKLVNEFKEFVMRGNVLDVIMPAVGWLIGTVSGQSFINAETGQPDFTKATEALNVGPIGFGNFIAAVINFLIMAIIIFAIVKAFNKLMTIPKKKKEEPEAAYYKEVSFLHKRNRHSCNTLPALYGSYRACCRGSRRGKSLIPTHSVKSSAVNFGRAGAVFGSLLRGSYSYFLQVSSLTVPYAQSDLPPVFFS